MDFQSSSSLDESPCKWSVDVMEKIGEGAFGTVFKALDHFDDSLCAIKVLANFLTKYSNQLFFILTPSFSIFPRFSLKLTYSGDSQLRVVYLRN